MKKSGEILGYRPQNRIVGHFVKIGGGNILGSAIELGVDELMNFFHRHSVYIGFINNPNYGETDNTTAVNETA